MIWGSLLLLGCGAGSTTEDTACGRQPPLDYDNFGHAHLDTHCNGCHSSLLPEPDRLGAPLGVDLDTEQGVLDQAERLAVRAVGPEPTMPPGGGPTGDELDHFEEWLDCTLLPQVRDSGESR